MSRANIFLALALVSELFLFSGCATSKRKIQQADEPEPPTMQGLVNNNEVSSDNDFDSVALFLDRVSTKHPEASTIWWADYRRAKLWTHRGPNVACENYTQLAQVPQFPLYHLAILRAYIECPKNNPNLTRLKPLSSYKFSPWLRGLYLKAAIRQAQLNHQYAKLVQLYLEKSRSWLRHKEKVRYSELALRAARWEHATLLKKRILISRIRKRIYSLSPSRNPHPSPSQYLDVAADFRYRRKFLLAHRYYMAVLRGRYFKPSDKLAAYQGLRMMYKIEQNPEHALVISRDMARYNARVYWKSKKTLTDLQNYMNTLFELAEDEWTQNHDRFALKILWKMSHTLKTQKSTYSSAEMAEVNWLHGRIDEERQKFYWAIIWYKRALNQHIASPDLKDRVLWSLAWNERKVRRYKQAVTILTALAKTNNDPFEKARYKFWLAKTLEQISKGTPHDQKEADADFSSLVKNDPFGYYGLLSARELDKKLAAGSLRDPADVKVGESNDSTPSAQFLTSRLKRKLNPIYLDWLISVNETQVADEYLNHVSYQLRQSHPDDISSWVSLLRAYSLSKNYLSMFTTLGNLSSDVRHEIISKHPKMLFPMPYSETVADSATRFGIEPELIYAIMRQESTFNPVARSPMDAFGLMQILPSVAARTARANSIPYRAADELYDPQVNIPIAAAYLRTLWDKYDGDIIPVVASYNARSTAIDSWLKTRFNGNTLEFVEDIPYDETRDYVKFVLRNLITYRLLNNSANTMHFPEWTLKISYQAKR